MGRQPSFQCYPNDWSRDLEEHPLEIEGAWIRICCKLWWAEERGKSCKPVEHWARLLSVDVDNLVRIMGYIEKFKIGDVTNNNNSVTVINRRMYREYKDRENTRLRVKRYREKQSSNTDVTPPSSSSSSIPIPKKEKECSAKQLRRLPVDSIKDDDWYETAQEKKLGGKSLSGFNDFCRSFGYMKGTSAAADSWLKVYHSEILQDILDGAIREFEARGELQRNGRTPKMMQGWLTERRWEDAPPVDEEPEVHYFSDEDSDG